MLNVADRKIYYFDFHCQYGYEEYASLFLAGLSYMGFDGGLMVYPETYNQIEKAIKDTNSSFLAIPGCEHMFEWGHILTWGYNKRLPKDRADYEEVLSFLKKKSKLSIFAHPLHTPTRPFLWDNNKFQKLFDNKAFDAVELVNANNYKRKGEKELYDWYDDMLASGKIVPITGGTDIHYFLASENKRKNILYRSNFQPWKDIDASATMRSLVIADKLDEKSIINAILSANVLTETYGKLIGPKKLIKDLESDDYWKKSQKHLKEIRNLQIKKITETNGQICNEITEKDKVKFQFDKNTKKVFLNNTAFNVTKNTSDTIFLPKIGDKNFAWYPLTITDGKNELFSTIKIKKPIELNFYGIREQKDNKVAMLLKIKNNSSRKLSGSINIHILQEKKSIKYQINAKQSKQVKVELPEITTDFDRIKTCRAELFIENNFSLMFKKDICFPVCKKIKNSVALNENLFKNASLDVFRIDKKYQVMAGTWEGIHDSSIKFILNWNSKGIYLSARSYDTKHFNPYNKDCIWTGDSIQFAIDPLYSCSSSTDYMWEFAAALTGTGPQLYLYCGPKAYEANYRIKKEGLLPKKCISIKKLKDGLFYNIFLPSDYLSPMILKSGKKFGFYFLQFDNDGKGQKSIITWPAPLDPWKNPSHWPAVTLI